MPITLPTSLSRFQKGLLFFAITMLLFSLGRGLLWLQYPAVFASLDGGQTLLAFANGLRFDSSVIARLFAIPMVLMWLPFKPFEHRLWFEPLAWLLYVVTLVLVLLLIGDVIYFAEVERHVSYELLAMNNDLGFLLSYSLAVYPFELLAFALFALLLGVLWRWILQLPTARSSYAPAKYLALFLLLAIIGRGGVSGKIIEIIDAYSGGDAAYGHLSLNGAFTTVVFALNLEETGHQFLESERLPAILDGEVNRVDSNYPMLNRYEGKPNGHNLVFVLMESWNFDFVDSFGGNGYGATPQFDALAREGLRFTNFFAAGQRSIDGIQATLTGIPVLIGLPRLDTGIGVSNISRLGSTAKEHGYSTIFMQTSSRDSYKMQGIATAMGFDHFYGREDIPLLLDYPDPAAAVFGWDFDTLQFLKEKIDRLEKPFLAYAFTGTTHSPYSELPSGMMRYQPHQAEGINGYLNTLSYADWSIGRFIGEARNSDWFENSIFVFTADHTTKLQKTRKTTDRFHIPLLIYAPGIVAEGESRVIGSQLDVMPTIIDLLGLDNEFAALGESLLRKSDGGEAFVSKGGQSIGLITPQGFVFHNLKQRTEVDGLPARLADRLEQRLLAKDQLSYELLKKNKWAR